MSRSPSPGRACRSEFSRVNAVSTSPRGVSVGSSASSSSTWWRRRARQQRERGGGEEGEGLEGGLYGERGRSQSPVHRLSGIGGGAMGSPAGTESVVMSSLARSHVSLSLSHTLIGRLLLRAPKTQEFIPGAVLVVTCHALKSVSQDSPDNLQTHRWPRSAGQRSNTSTVGTWGVAPPPAATLTWI